MDSRVENFPTVDVVSFMQLFDAANIKQSNVQGLVFNQEYKEFVLADRKVVDDEDEDEDYEDDDDDDDYDDDDDDYEDDEDDGEVDVLEKDIKKFKMTLLAL